MDDHLSSEIDEDEVLSRAERAVGKAQMRLEAEAGPGPAEDLTSDDEPSSRARTLEDASKEMNDLTSTLIGLVDWFHGERYQVTPIGQQAARRLLKIVVDANRAFGSWHERVTRLAIPDLAVGDLEDAKLFEVEPAFRTIAAKVYALGGPHPGPEPAAVEPGEIDEAKMLRSLAVPGALRDFTLTLEAYRQQLEELL